MLAVYGYDLTTPNAPFDRILHSDASPQFDQIPWETSCGPSPIGGDTVDFDSWALWWERDLEVTHNQNARFLWSEVSRARVRRDEEAIGDATRRQVSLQVLISFLFLISFLYSLLGWRNGSTTFVRSLPVTSVTITTITSREPGSWTQHYGRTRDQGLPRPIRFSPLL